MSDEIEKSTDQGDEGIKIPGINIDIKKAGNGLALAAVLGYASAPGSTQTAPVKEEPPVVTHHSIKIGDKSLSYKVTTGLMPLKNEAGETEANIFYMAYTKVDAGSASKRPLMFSFNGGPGSASVWLHLGALGPKRVKMLPDGGLPPPPYKLEDNPQTWLDETDIVFIDPVGTGFSRPVKPENGKKYWGLQGDIDSVGEFIRLYITRNERWTSPLFLVGESYGTTRAAGLAGNLIEKGIAFNGIVLVSTILNFGTVDEGSGNDLPNILFLPTYTATAWYHKKLDAELQKDLKKTLAEVEKFADTDYTLALMKGDSLPEKERKAIYEKVARYTGLSRKYVDQMHGRIEIMHFCKELLREEGATVGRLDSRLTGVDRLPASENFDFDPSMTAIRPPYTAMFNDYVRRDLGYKTDSEYYILGGGIKAPWDWGGNPGYPDTSESLRSAFAKNPYMKLFVAFGYYDLATPYHAARYTLNHMGLDKSVRKNITEQEYEAGHMMYIHEPSLHKLRVDIGKFIAQALPIE